MERLPHAILDREPRLAKGRKVATIVAEHMSLEGTVVLDVGTGGGFIAEYFSRLVGDEGRVVGVDRIRQLPEESNVEFHLVADAGLPFENETFDLVISNHVIEHVGEQVDQFQHFKELRRVVKSGGLIYLATPNRWTPFEPHFRLPFLCWMPKTASTFFVRLFNRGVKYDCELLTRPQLRTLAADAQLRSTDVTARALQVYGGNEIKGVTGKLIAAFPDWLATLVAGLWFIPSLVFLLSRTDAGRENHATAIK
jgi:SAM-dependent methyltransferase